MDERRKACLNLINDFTFLEMKTFRSKEGLDENLVFPKGWIHNGVHSWAKFVKFSFEDKFAEIIDICRLGYCKFIIYQLLGNIRSLIHIVCLPSV